MPKVQDIKPDKVKLLLIGESGTGKTHFSETFPGPIYWFDMDLGLLTLRHSTKEIDYDSYVDNNSAQPMAARAADAKLKELAKSCPYSTVVIDSITTLSDIAMNEVLKNNGRPDQTPQQQDWLQQMNWISNFIVRAKNLPCNVVFIAHENMIKDETTGAIKILPLVTGKMAGRIQLLFDEVYYTQAVNSGGSVKYKLLVRANGVRSAKTRLDCDGKLDSYETPDYEEIMKKLST